MKPAVRVRIGKAAFTLEQEAYDILKEYLDSLERHFAGNPSGKEIMEEIEVRMAELLLEKCGSGVVSEKMVREACGTLGSVDDITSDKASGQGGDKAEPAGTGSADGSADGRKVRKLYRNPDDKMLGGVCSGLAAYFDKEPMLFRVIAVAIFLFFTLPSRGVGFWIPLAAYIVLWLVIPEARTVGQRYQMRGEKNTIDSIMENVEKGAQEMGDAARKFNDRHPDLLRVVMRSVSVAVGSAFIIIAVLLLIALGLGLAGTAFVPVDLRAVTASLLGPQNTTLSIAALCAILLIPLISLLYLGIRMAFNLRSPRLRLGLILFLIWLAGVGTLGWMGTKAAFHFESGERQFAETAIRNADGTPADALGINMAGSDMNYDYIWIDADEDSYELVMISDGAIYAYPEIRVRRDGYASGISVRSSAINFEEKTKEPDFCSYADGTLTVRPMVMDGSRRLEDAERVITITMPESAKLKVNSPRYHDFETRQQHTNIPMLK